MKVITKKVSIDLFNNNILTAEILELLKRSNKIYFIPETLHRHILKRVKQDPTLNTTKFWMQSLELYSMLINNINNSKHLYKVDYNYSITIKEWQKDKVLSNNRGSYDVSNGKTFSYTFRETNEYCLVIIDDDNSIKKDVYVDLDDNYRNALLNSTIDLEKAIFDEYNNMKSVELFVKRLNLIFNFLKRRYIKKGDKVNRWYNSFSSLTSISRKYIKYNNQYFYEIDLSNAQPTLLCIYLIKLYGEQFDERFIYDTSNGLFYNSIMDKANELGIEGERTWDSELKTITYKSFTNRDDVKTLTYQNIFFGLNENTEVFKIFKRLYPNTWRLLNLELNSGDETLSTKLQNMEAGIFLNIKPDCPYFTVHDAIYITDKSKKDYVINKIKELVGSDLFSVKCNFEEQDKKRYTDIHLNIDNVDGMSIFLIDSVNRKPHKPHKQHSNSKQEEIIKLKEQGLSANEIISNLGISKKTYYKWIKETS